MGSLLMSCLLAFEQALQRSTFFSFCLVQYGLPWYCVQLACFLIR